MWPPSRLRGGGCVELSVVVQGRALPPVTLARRHRGSALHPTYTSGASGGRADEYARRPYADSPLRDGISSLWLFVDASLHMDLRSRRPMGKHSRYPHVLLTC